MIAASVLAAAFHPGPAAATKSSGLPATAVNVDALANVLATAFLAQNLSLVCSQRNQWFLEDTKGSAGDGRQFADHIRAEVLSRVSERDAGMIVVSAANAARSVSLGLVHVMNGGGAAEEQARLDAWCETTAKPLVRGILAQHDIRHDLYDRMLQDAKQ